MEQGFAPASGMKVARQARVPHELPRLPNTSVHVAARTTTQDKTIAAASTVREIFVFPIMTLGLPAMAATAVAFVTGKLRRERTTAVLGGVGEAILHGPRTTLGSKALELPADMLQTMAKKANDVGGRAQGMVVPLTNRSESLRASVQGVQTSIGRFVEKMPGPVKKVLTYAGSKPVGAILATVGAAAGITAIWTKRSKTLSLKEETLNSMAQALGATHPLVLQANGLNQKAKPGSAAASTVESSGELINVVFEAVPTLGMMTIMPMVMAQSVLGSATEAFIPENTIADAWVRAQQPNADAKDKVNAYSQLIAALPQAQQRGANHPAAVGLAQLLVKKHASFDDVVATLREPAKFEALAKEFMETQQAAGKTAQPATAASAQHPVMHGAVPAAKVTGSVHKGQGLQGAAKSVSAPAPHTTHTARAEAATAETAHPTR